MARCRFARLLLACGILFASGIAEAQEPQKDPQKDSQDDRRFGLTFCYPGSSPAIGVIWQTSDRLALRPEVSFSSRFASTSATDGWSVSATLSVLRYVGRKAGVSPYVGPRFSYSWATSIGGSSKSTNSSYGVGAAAGLQYALTRRISLYGEAGLSYAFSRSTYSNPGYSGETHGHSIGSRSSVGLNLYF